MSSPSARAPLINRPLVGILALVGLIGGVALLVFGSFDNVWGASLLRVGILLGAGWLALVPTRRVSAPRHPLASWITAALAGTALVAIRSRKPVLVGFIVAAFTVLAFIVKPRPRS